MMTVLYIRVCCRSYAEVIKEKEKVERKSIRKHLRTEERKSLRTEIRRKFICRKYLECFIELLNVLEVW